MDIIGKTDALVALEIRSAYNDGGDGGGGAAAFRPTTPVVADQLDPVWNWKCALDVADRYVDVLRCVVYDQDLTKREVVGEVLVLLAPLELHARVDDWYPIVQADGSAQSSRSLFSFASATADDDDQTEKSRGFLRLKLKLEPLA